MERFTLSTLAERARLYADEREIGHLSTTEVALFVDDAARDVRAWVLSEPDGAVFWERNEQVSIGTTGIIFGGTTGAGSIYTSTLYDIDSVGEFSILWSSTIRERLEEVSMAAFVQLGTVTWSQSGAKGYRFGVSGESTYVAVAPIPTSAVIARLRYVPAWSTLADATTSVAHGPDGMRKAISASAAMAMRGMQGLPTTFCEKMVAQARDTMRKTITRVVRTFGRRVLDVDPEGELGAVPNPYDILPPP